MLYDKFELNSIDKAPNTVLDEKSDSWLNFKDKTDPSIKIIGIWSWYKYYKLSISA